MKENHMKTCHELKKKDENQIKETIVLCIRKSIHGIKPCLLSLLSLHASLKLMWNHLKTRKNNWKVSRIVSLNLSNITKEHEFMQVGFRSYPQQWWTWREEWEGGGEIEKWREM